MAKKLIRWFTYNLIFALLPLGASLCVRALLYGNLTTDVLANTPEILFFSLMVSATAMGDLSEIAKPLGWDNLFRIFWFVLFFGAIWSAFLYGIYIYDSISGPGSIEFRKRLLSFSMGLSIVFVIFSTTVEVLIAKIEK